jgi:dimethylargininase
VENVRAVIKKELDLPLVEIADKKAKLEGGDVLFTGKEFFVGISEFTNMEGALAVAR